MLRTARPKATATRRRRPGASSSPTGGAAPRRASQRSDSGRERRIAVPSTAGGPRPARGAGEGAAGRGARRRRAERGGEEHGVRRAPGAERAGDRVEQEGVEDEVVEIEEPPGPGERQDSVVERGRAIVLAEQHRGREATRGAHTSTRGAPPV